MKVVVRRIRRGRNNDIKLYVEQEVRESNKGLGTLSKARIPLDEGQNTNGIERVTEGI